MGVPLNEIQVESVFSRFPTLRARVIEFNLLVSVLTWDQVRTTPGFLEFDIDIPGAIPSDGVYVQDTVFGIVICFPDALGTLHFTGNNTSSSSAHQVGTSGVASLPGLPSLPNFNLVFVVLGLIALAIMAIIGHDVYQTLT